MDTTHPGDQAAVRGLGGRRRGWGGGHAAGRRSTTLLISGRMVPGLLKGCFDIGNMSPSASPTLHPYLSIKISRTTSLHQHYSIYISLSPSLHSPSTSFHRHLSHPISPFSINISPSASFHLHLCIPISLFSINISPSPSLHQDVSTCLFPVIRRQPPFGAASAACFASFSLLYGARKAGTLYLRVEGSDALSYPFISGANTSHFGHAGDKTS